jgi:hypothetical protein
MPAQADAVDMTMLHAIWRQCRLSRCGRLRHAVSVTMPAQPMRPSVPCGLCDHAGSADAPCGLRDRAVLADNASPRSRGKCRVIPMLSASADNASPHSRGKCRVMPMLSASADNASPRS